MTLKRMSSNAVRGEFARTLEGNQTDPFIDRVAYFNKDSNQFSETYGFLGDIPQFKEFIGSRQREELESYQIVVANKKFETTLSVGVEEVEWDKTAQVSARIAALSEASPAHLRSFLTDLINAGTSKVCYDGQFFFDTDHPHGEGLKEQASNKITVSLTAVPVAADYRGTMTAPSAATMNHAILQAVQQLMTFKSDKGRPINEQAKTFEVIFL